MGQVMTVTGPVDGNALGTTLPHEHLFIDGAREYRGLGVFNDYELMRDEVLAYIAAGGRTLVECTSGGLTPNPVALQKLSLDTGLQIILGCGFYRDPYLDRDWFDRHDHVYIGDGIVRELEEGVDGSDVRAGVIGEVGCDKSYMSAVEERSLRAAAYAQVQTGVTITTHAIRTPVGLKQLQLLEASGVDPRRVIIGHCDTVPDTGYHETLARSGAFVQFDTIRGRSEYDCQRRVGFILNMFDKGFGSQLLLSHDNFLFTHLHAGGGYGYDYLLTSFWSRLLDAGLSEADLSMVFIDNPRRALTGDV